MARLLDGEIEKLKQDVSLPDLVQSYGVKLIKKVVSQKLSTES